MKRQLNISPETSGLWLDNNITYARVPGWLGQSTRNLRLSIIKHFDTSKKQPAIFWFAGGGWMDTNHNIHLPNLVSLAQKGYVIIGVEYRDSNKVKFPAQLEDAKAAIRFIREYADDYGVDTDNIIAMGESAGGHLASMLGVTNGMEKFDVGAYKNQSSNISLAVPLYGVVSMLTAKQGSATNDFDFVYKNLLGEEPEDAPGLNDAANPESYINGNTVPFLIFHGTNDAVVPFKDGEGLYEALQAKNVISDFYEIIDGEHMDVKFLQPEVFDIIDAFIRQHL